jgi:hypothetical protein
VTDAEILLLVGAAIYCSECVNWLPARCLVLTGGHGRMRCAAAPEFLGNEHKRLFVLSLLPTTTTLVARHPAYLFCDESLLLELDNRTWQLLTFGQIAASEVRADGDRVLIGEHRFQAGTRRAARQLCRLIQRLAEAPQPSPLVAAHLRRYTDPERAERRTHVLRERLQLLQQLQFMLLTWIFGAGIFLYYFSAAPWQALLRYLSIAVVIWMAAIGVAWCCSRRLNPAGSSDRWKELFFSLVSPMHAVRASDRLSLDALGDEHPLAVAIATMPHRRLEPLARQYIAELRHPLTSESPVSDDSQATRALLRDSRRTLADALADSLSRKGIDVDKLSLPDQQDQDAVCWCQRCFSQYTRLINECPSCPGVATRKFADGPSNINTGSTYHENGDSEVA